MKIIKEVKADVSFTYIYIVVKIINKQFIFIVFKYNAAK